MGYDPDSRRMLIGQVLVANLRGIALAPLMNRFTIVAQVFQLPGDTDLSPTYNV